MKIAEKLRKAFIGEEPHWAARTSRLHLGEYGHQIERIRRLIESVWNLQQV